MVNGLDEQFKAAVLITACVVLYLGVVSGKSVKHNFEEIYQEPPCLARDGFCTLIHECPFKSRFTARGLCPTQQAQGIECCKEMSSKAPQCEKKGGSCFPSRHHCHNLAIVDYECPKDYSCCFIPDMV